MKEKILKKNLNELFPFKYQGGGYFRKKGVEKGKSAEILHGIEAIEYLYEQMTKEDEGVQLDGLV